MTRSDWRHDARASLESLREALGELQDRWGFACEDDPIDDDDDDDDAYEYDQLSSDIETALDTLVDELTQHQATPDVEELTVDELLARYVTDGLVSPEQVKVAAALVDALGSRGSRGARTSELIMGPSYEQLLSVVDALERLVDHTADGEEEPANAMD
ncbi:hypothetical protein OV203_25165 [Nannocystis sp. ILAH1]|uniref:hypothetical protein n=1 Tax=unclassified Nannocystis TaxID=2627009 RepID=UPI002271025C|nr:MULTISPECIES: hypothetical protein [unclassified Nannocystis]MCY0990456.1 hypothetical protein [Nannocystis sp. ILAH1]MCY1069256.1 hypothetical protein [Nannocystis sp. RBIL2]